jgi:hypothetical protein
MIVIATDDIIGVWQGAGFDAMAMKFNDDGTCLGAFRIENLESTPNLNCTFYFEDDQIFITAVDTYRLPVCDNDTAIYTVYQWADGGIELVVVEDACPGRARSMSVKYMPVP